ncbi:MAG: cyclic nucleotide-binding domain-containing protein [Anaerolineales bacterium]|nr:cyclic nucleotide-binding domain-containing protein [Anaerolineales bacterium]
MDNPEAYLGRLKPIFIFRGLTDDQILEFAHELVVERHPPETVIFNEGDEGDSFYIIHDGAVRVRRQVGREVKQVATLVPGDFFGERSLLYSRKRSATIETGPAEVALLRLNKADFERLLRKFPQIKPNLLLSTESLDLYRRHPFKWLEPDEVVYLITRKHKLLLIQALLLPFLLAVALALAAVWLAVLTNQLWVAWVGAALELPLAAWMVWSRIDWGNDFYIVTNQRLVYLEKIIGLYDSRQEAPLNSIVSVDVQTDAVLQRWLNMGDVVVRTYSGPITLHAMTNPAALESAIKQHWLRTLTRADQAHLDEIRATLRNRLTRGFEQARLPTKPASQPKPPPPSLAEQLARTFSFRVRFEEGASVIYRKHWYMLALSLWKPSLGLFLVLMLVAIELAGWLPAALPRMAVLLVALAAFIPLAGWWLYEYIDWRNDIYMVTEDQIFDIAKKPLGAETKKSAPLGNVLSLKSERPGLIGVLLNYGTVVAQVAGADFRFEGVFDPASVQKDVYRRMEQLKNKKAAAQSAREREELAKWLKIYHDEFENPPGPGPAT